MSLLNALVKAILEEAGIKYHELKIPSTNQILYRVMAGSYATRENAAKQVEKLKGAGFDATIMIYKN